MGLESKWLFSKHKRMSIHFHTIRVSDVRKETDECVSVAFDIPSTLKEVFSFHQGQNIVVKAVIDGEEVRRNYSICCSPSDNELRIAVKLVEGGKFSTYACRSLKKGDSLELMPPTGKFFTELDSLHQKTYVAFAAGSGITPIYSIICTTLETEPHSKFLLVYGNRNRGGIIFREQLEALKNRYIDRFQLIHVLSRERMDSTLQSGRIDAEKCRMINEKIMPLADVDDFFICGPEEMIGSVQHTLLGLGISRQMIHVELFHSAGEKKIDQQLSLSKHTPHEPRSAKVTVRLDGVTTTFALEFDGDTILNAAMKLGIDVPYACKGGMCCTCRAKLESGEVDMDLNYALEHDEVEAGFILTCQSHPRTEQVSVNYDIR
jgi:ring-1,2-phenylacetyl-CoA epoxidase subunit PaaE